MKEKMFIHGYEAVGRGALNAGCLHFCGYPITPQNEITEFFARELPERGGRFVQAESEASSASMIFGVSLGGVRVMTSTASPGWGLMQEILSHISFCELPCVVVNVQRGGPGQGRGEADLCQPRSWALLRSREAQLPARGEPAAFASFLMISLPASRRVRSGRPLWANGVKKWP